MSIKTFFTICLYQLKIEKYYMRDIASSEKRQNKCHAISLLKK